ncbi:hypothetical protein EAG_10042 [Camponotus floridanus]|uniref:Uncharacterized protein n=1 Tax=Camponotus floridanus TaxID=104421 RepID=E2AV59_CAMFO|nr:hypothetical protein EAG_10042 [Camponotus floridanus]
MNPTDHLVSVQNEKKNEARSTRFVIPITRLSQNEADLQESENTRRQVRNKIPLRHSRTVPLSREDESSSSRGVFLEIVLREEVLTNPILDRLCGSGS